MIKSNIMNKQKGMPAGSRWHAIPISTGGGATVAEARNSNPHVAREIDRVSDWLFRMLILAVVLLSGTMLNAGPIKFINCLPENGSDISDFYFTLVFDIEDAILEAGEGEWGIGNSGASTTSTRNKHRTILYEGEPGNGIELARALTSNFNGTSEGFKVGGNTISFSFPQDLKPEVGKSYYLEIGNVFYIYPKGGTSGHSSTKLSFNDEPLIIRFVGASPSDDELVFQKASIQEGMKYKELKDIKFSFSGEINLCSEGRVVILENSSEIFSTSDLSLSEDKYELIASFSHPINLYSGHNYTIILESESACLVSNPNVKNRAVSISVNGENFIKVPVLSVSPENNFKGLVDNICISFDVPSGLTLTPPNGRIHSRKGELYMNEVKEENLIANLIGKVTEDGMGQQFNLSDFSLLPETTYIFVKPANEITLWKDGVELPEYGNEEFAISWTTPSVEELNLAPITLGTPKIGDYADPQSPDFIEGGTYANINTMDVLKEEYSNNGESCGLTLDWDNAKVVIYDVTGGTRNLVKEGMLAVNRREDPKRYYGVFVLYAQMDFLEGHDYEIVIPKGSLRLQDNKQLYNYVTNEDIVYRLKGATPSEFKIESCTVEDNAEVSAIPAAIVWKLNGAYSLKSIDAVGNAQFSGKVGDLLIGGGWNPPITIYKQGYVTYASVQLGDQRTGVARNLRKGEFLTVTVPAGSILYPGDDSISNPELKLTLAGSYEVEVIPEAEMVEVSLNVNGLHTSTHKSAKGKPYALMLTPEENWTVESVSHDGKELTAADGVYTTEPLEDDTNITANIAYAGPWADYSELTGVWTVNESNVRIYRDGEHIVVEGVSAANEVNVYGISGLHINSTRVSEGKDCLRISVAPGQTYIVTVDCTAAKIRM